MINFETKESKEIDFQSLKISVASPEQILNWSYGEVLKPETINYRTQRPERDGLFDEKIFGPTKDYECYCGKYKKIRYRGVICDKCGVEVTRSAVRRERMGHIDLAAAVAHIWYVRGIPSVLGLLLDLSVADLERVIYFAGFVVKEVREEALKEALASLEREYQRERSNLLKQKSVDLPTLEATFKQLKAELNSLKPLEVISESRYHDLSLKYGAIVKVGIGAEAIWEILEDLDLKKLKDELEEELLKTPGQERRKLLRRLRLAKDMLKAKIQPSWLIFSRLPVIPPDLRPMVQLDGGRFAASDLNDLYRRVLNRNNRLKRLIAQGAPEVIIRNEKRMLQEAVDALIDNQARRGRAATTTTARKLRSLSDMLRGKQGRFRQNLLGKRVDYSGRSVIVIGPELTLDECGLPKVMALELFKPFVIHRLIADGFVHNVKNASRLIERQTPEVWDILEDITKDYYVLLNRAPTLHRLGIQAFKPVLIEGKAIQIHPLVTAAFNADFDGDQMAVHIPLSLMARQEASKIMRSSLNLLKPASGEPLVAPRLDIVAGCYWLTSIQENAKGEGKAVVDADEAILAYEQGHLHPRAKIKVKLDGEILETTLGRIFFNRILPTDFPYQNEVMNTKNLRGLTSQIFKKYGNEITAAVVNEMKNIGFEFATLSGLTIAIDDIVVPANKDALILETEKVTNELERQFRRGLITEEERKARSLELWIETRDKVEKSMTEAFSAENPVKIVIDSGARGSYAQITQLGGMKGLVVNPAGEIIELPITSNYKEGLSVLEYFISTHGARKGKSDTSLRTSDAGYLTRRLADVAQDIFITAKDCKTKQGIRITKESSVSLGLSFAEKITGWVALKNVVDPKTKEVWVKKDQLITEEVAKKIEQSDILEVWTRSVLTCELTFGICQMCYGEDLARKELVKLGEIVGVMAAQAIGEPGTQLTMRTFHMGGVTGLDITTGLPRVEELFEARTPRNAAILAEVDSKVNIQEEKNRRLITLGTEQDKEETYQIKGGYKVLVKDQSLINLKQPLISTPEGTTIRSKVKGKALVSKDRVTVIGKEKIKMSYPVSLDIDLKVADGDQVNIGQELTVGPLDLPTALRLKDKEEVARYIVNEVSEIYASQGQKINDKHLEVIVRQMFSKVKIKDAQDSDYLAGQIVDKYQLLEENKKIKEKNGKMASFEEIVMGITRVALKTHSFLSAASFQETVSVLVDAAIKGSTDPLRGLKENVIIGKLIPAGAGFSLSGGKREQR